MKKSLIILRVIVAIVLFALLVWLYQYGTKKSALISSQNRRIPESTVVTGWILVDTGNISIPTSNTLSGLIQSGIVSTGETVLVSTGKLNTSGDCFFDICIDSTKAVIRQPDGTLIQASDPEFDVNGGILRLNYITKYNPSRIYSDIVQVNKLKGFASKNTNDGYSTEYSITKKWVYYVRIDGVGGCTGISHKQTILDQNGLESDISKYIVEYPKQFVIGDLNYVYSGSTVNYDSVSLYTPEQITYTGKLSIHDDLSKAIHDFAVWKKFLAKNYVIEFREIPGVKMLYTSSLVPADRLVSLGMDVVWKEKNIIQNELMDLDVTKKILSYYNNSGRWVTMKNSNNGYEDMITDSGVITEQLPIFRVVPIDTAGNYLLYTTPNYEIAQFAELCKPLVYIYSSNSEKNSLSVLLPSGWYFSKLIPHFSYGNTWEFNSQSSGDIGVDATTYGYLYYSAKVPNYQWNTDGWQVYGADIVRFFEDKLPKTGMNAREMNDFISFWKSEFKKDIRYFVSFKFDDAIDPYVKLQFSKEPDALHRILLEAYPIEGIPSNDFYLWPRIGERFDARLLRSFVRSGKRDVLEWGWVVFDHDKNTYIIK